MKKNVIIDLKHISVKLGDNQVLDDLSLYIRDREFITLLGLVWLRKDYYSACHCRFPRTR